MFRKRKQALYDGVLHAHVWRCKFHAESLGQEMEIWVKVNDVSKTLGTSNTTLVTGDTNITVLRYVKRSGLAYLNSMLHP